MVKCTPEKGHKALFLTPSQVFIVLLWKIIVKKCQKCGSHDVIRKGVKHGSSYWYCKSCQCYFSGREKPNNPNSV